MLLCRCVGVWSVEFFLDLQVPPLCRVYSMLRCVVRLLSFGPFGRVPKREGYQKQLHDCVPARAVRH